MLGFAQDALDVHALCVQLATASCQHNVDCNVNLTAQLPACVASFGCENPGSSPVVQAEIDAGRAMFDAARFANCLAALADAGCDELGSTVRNNDPDCVTYFGGLGQPGSPCLSGVDCAGDTTCLRFPDTCAGVCSAEITGGACGVGKPETAIGYNCEAGQAVALAGDGGACQSSADCAPHFRCEGLTGNLHCLPSPTAGAGEPCFGNNTCAFGSACFFFKLDGGPGICYPENGVGGPCGVTYPDGGRDDYVDGGQRANDALCLSFEYCDLDTLTCAPDSNIGGPCNVDGGNPQCDVGACDPATGLCAFLADGQPCSASLDCASAHCVYGDAGSLICAKSCP